MALALGVSTYTYMYDRSLDETLAHLAKLGFHRLEVPTFAPHIWPRDLNKKERIALRRKFESYGHQVVSTQGHWLDMNLATYNPGIRAEAKRQIDECIELLHDLGGQVLVMMPGRLDTTWGIEPYETAWTLAREMISSCAEKAERLGVTLAIETSVRNFVQTADEAVRMAKEIDSPAVKVAIDLANVSRLQSPIEALKKAKDVLALLHVNDNDGPNISKKPVGDGTIDMAAVAATLRDIRFEGVSIIELLLPTGRDEAILQSKAALEKLGWQA